MDFDNDSRGRTLLSTVHTCYERLPIVVTTSEDVEDACSLAYANGARTCLRKPLSAIGFTEAIADMTGAASRSPDLTRSKYDEQNYRSEFSASDC